MRRMTVIVATFALSSSGMAAELSKNGPVEGRFYSHNVQKPVGAVTLNPERDIIIRAATSQILLSGSIGEPAFPSRPGSAKATERNAGDGRSRATRSHAQSALAREHGEAGEHRTFSAVSIVARSSSVGSPHLRTSTPQAQRHRR